MSKSPYIPYMGNKRAIATQILEAIASSTQNPTSRRFVDLFGGGGSISIAALLSEEFGSVLYNEFNPYIFALFSFLREHEIPEKWYEFLSREEFKEIKANPQNYDPAYVGVALSCWTFGNSPAGSYLYSYHNDSMKENLHRIIVNLDTEAAEKVGLSVLPVSELLPLSIKQRRLWQNRQFKQQNQHLERLQHLENLQHLERLKYVGESIEVSNLSYEELTFKEGDIVYCDPPYKNTTGYSGGFDYDAFLRWVEALTDAGVSIFVSEYNFDSPSFSEILSLPKRAMSGASGSSVVKTEKLYYNGR